MTLRRLLVVFAVLALLGCGQERAGAPPAPVGPPRHVFLVTVDTLRADHLGVYGYPRATSPEIDELAAGGVVFERAIAQWPKTGPSFASMFTGRYPKTTGITHHAAVRVPAELPSLPELFRAAGFSTVAVVSNAVLNKNLAWDRGFDEYLETWSLAPEVSDVPAEYRRWIDARKVLELATPLLERHRDAPRLFAWIHFSDPHAPYLLPAGETSPFVGDAWYTDTSPVELENPEATKLGDEHELRYYVAQYDANVRFTDRHVGALLDHARGLGLLDDAVVVFTADHGESLGDHGYYFAHGRLPYNDCAHVPLVVAAPGRLGARRVADPVELIDLVPTLHELAGLGPPPAGIDGRSLGPLLRGETGATDEAAVAFSEAGGGSPLTYFRSIQDRTWKLVFHPELKRRKGDRPPRLELYRLDVDPAERQDLAATEEVELRRLSRRLREWMGEDGDAVTGPSAAPRDEETEKALKALGYAGG